MVLDLINCGITWNICAVANSLLVTPHDYLSEWQMLKGHLNKILSDQFSIKF